MTSYWWLLGHVTLLFYLTTRSRDFSITFFIIYFYYCLLIFEETILVCVFYMAFIYVLLLLCILLCTHGYYMFTCHCCQRFIYVNKLSCTTDEGLTTENFGSYHYTILHQNRTLSSFLSIHYWCGKHIFISIYSSFEKVSNVMRVFKEVLRHLRIFADDLTPQKRNLALGYGRNIHVLIAMLILLGLV